MYASAHLTFAFIKTKARRFSIVIDAADVDHVNILDPLNYRPSPDLNDDVIKLIPISMWGSKNKSIAEGYLIIIHEDYISLTYCYVYRQKIVRNRHGAFHHNDMIGDR